MSERIHFIGVGGSGMSAVARLLAAAGHQVTGTDAKESAYFRALAEAGLDVRIGHDPALVEQADRVVISTAVRDSNVELLKARELGIPVLHRSEALRFALDHKTLVAVAGAHGKTTTSALTAHVLHHAGIDASFAVGARVFGVEGAVAGGYAGSSDIAVFEADESDKSFLRFSPRVSIITNVEPDHLDNYGTYEAIVEAFIQFAHQSETVVLCVDDAGAREVLAGLADHPHVVTYGRSEQADAHIVGQTVTWQGRTVLLEPALPGNHQLLNATAAWVAAVEVGADPERAAQAAATFAGTGRRFEFKGSVGGVDVIDDYAHHPTEVAAVVAGARSAGYGRLVLLFQPALFSRTQSLATEFARALEVENADIVLAPVYGDREDPIEGVSSQLIAGQMVVPENSRLTLAHTLDEAAQIAADRAESGSLVLTVGSGTVTTAAPDILERLRTRFA